MRNLFPFESIRSGQSEFMRDVEATVRGGGHLMAHAPTGIGKTIAALAPALSHALESSKTVFFLTPKHTQHIIAIDTLQKVKRKFNISVKAVDIIGKQWMCPHKVQDLNSRDFNEFCRAQKKDEVCVYYNNTKRKTKGMKKVVDEIKEKLMHNEEIRELCSVDRLCPYEVCIEVGRGADVIICDYFHLFSPQVRKSFLGRLGKTVEDSILIIDEAHNLPERVRKIMSHNLSEKTLMRAMKEARILGHPELEDDFRDIADVLKNLGKGMVSGGEKFISKEDFISKLSGKLNLNYDDFTGAVDDLGEEVLKIPGRYRSYSKTVARFLENWKSQDLGYARILRKDKGRYYILSYDCLDPSISCGSVFNEAHATVFMSGTLMPLDMYASVLGIQSKRTTTRMYASPFPKENRLLLIVSNVTTKYTLRSELMYNRYARLIREMLEAVPGNAAVFYPSYLLLETITSSLEKDPKKEILVERQGMVREDRRRLHEKLMTGENKVLMGVQAGSLSEGVDYPNNVLSAVLIVGLPLEKPNLETKALIDYYDFKFQRGWDYGYIYPAMNRALQAAGRCIRSETDKAAIVLMDERFRWRNYAKCLPPDYDFIVTETPEKYLKKFFSGVERTK